MKGLIRITLVLSFVLTGIGSAAAQTLPDAQKAYNEAITKASANDPAGAIELLNSCIELCGEVGDEAVDLKVMSEAKLTEQYFNLGGKQAKAKENEKAIATFKETAKLADLYKHTDVAKKTSDALAKLYTSIGYDFLKEKKVAEAIQHCDMALEIDPNYGTAWYIKCFALKSANDDEGLEAAADQGIEVCVTNNDSRNLKNIQKLGRDYFLQKGSKDVAASKFEDGVSSLQKALKYDNTNKDIYYYLATAQNGVENYVEAAKSANKGLELETGDAEKKAKYYYALGNALKGQGDKDGACAAFNNALYGPFEEGAKYEIEHELKCN